MCFELLADEFLLVARHGSDFALRLEMLFPGGETAHRWPQRIKPGQDAVEKLLHVSMGHKRAQGAGFAVFALLVPYRPLGRQD